MTSCPNGVLLGKAPEALDAPQGTGVILLVTLQWEVQMARKVCLSLVMRNK